MTPEMKVFFFAGAVMLVAYTVIYTRLPEKTIFVMGRIDTALTAAILAVVGIVYYGRGIGFSMVFFDAPWWLFTFLIKLLFEVPFFVWFCKRWNVDLNPPVD